MKIISFFLLLLLCCPCYAQELACEKIANYEIEVRLNTQDNTLDGREFLHWKNTSSQSVDELFFHLYWNAFKNSESTFIKEIMADRDRRDRYLSDRSEERWGWIEVSSLFFQNGTQSIDITDSMIFVQPDDNNSADLTVF